jgi:hypothetical protein
LVAAQPLRRARYSVQDLDWSKVQCPLRLGGLGVLDLHSMGLALRVRCLRLQRIDPERPWSTMPADEDMVTRAFFQASVRWEIGNGESIFFWSDAWLQGQAIGDLFPQLAAAVQPRHRRSRRLSAALSGDAWVHDITGALTVPVLSQYLHLRALIAGVQLDAARPDRLIWAWSASAAYSSASAYNVLFTGQTVLQGAKELWKTRAPNSCRLFFWLALLGRCWTSDRLLRHGLPNHAPCALCSQEEQTIDHLLLRCVVSREVWFKVLRKLGWHLVRSWTWTLRAGGCNQGNVLINAGIESSTR